MIVINKRKKAMYIEIYLLIDYGEMKIIVINCINIVKYFIRLIMIKADSYLNIIVTIGV